MTAAERSTAADSLHLRFLALISDCHRVGSPYHFFCPMVIKDRKKQVEHAMNKNDICMKQQWTDVLDFLSQLNGSKERIREIRIKQYENNKWKVSVIKERPHGVGLHDLFW